MSGEDMPRKTPHQKKQESYEKDRRNTYGESGARSRFAVARRKRNRRSRERAAARQALNIAVQDPEKAERLEATETVIYGGRWRKYPDEPLGDVLERSSTGACAPAVCLNKSPTRRLRGFAGASSTL